MSSNDLLLCEDRGSVRILTINRPSKLNALNRATIDALDAAFDDVEGLKGIRALVLTGAGEKAFVAGADISELATLSPVDALAFSEHGQRLMRRIEQFPVPVIAAINGFALGGGCELALACTLRVAGARARLGLPEIGLGIMPGFGGTQRVARLAGRSVALDLALTGRQIDAQSAERLGLVHRVSDQTSPLDDALELAEALTASAPVAVRHIIAAIGQGIETPLDQALATESQLFALCCATEDMREGTRAFMEKRKAEFTGR